MIENLKAFLREIERVEEGIAIEEELEGYEKSFNNMEIMHYSEN